MTEPGIHRAWKMVSPYETLHVDPTIAIHHHYREIEVTGKDFDPRKYKDRLGWKVDTYARELSSKRKLGQVVANRFIQFKDICQLNL
jgi:hypothetical protein